MGNNRSLEEVAPCLRFMTECVFFELPQVFYYVEGRSSFIYYFYEGNLTIIFNYLQFHFWTLIIIIVVIIVIEQFLFLLVVVVL